MFKVCLFAVIVAVASAGLVGISGTSYQNNNQLSIHPIPVVAQIKTIAAAPIAIAAPIGIGKLGGIGLGLGGGCC